MLQGVRFDSSVHVDSLTYTKAGPLIMLRSYHHESTQSHQNSEVKRGWA